MHSVLAVDLQPCKAGTCFLQKPLVGTPFPMPYISTKRSGTGSRGMSRLSEKVTKDCPTDVAESLTSSRAQQPPSSWSHLLLTGTHTFPYTEPKETQLSSPTSVIAETSTKWLLIEGGMEVHFSPRQPGVPVALQTHRCVLQGAQPYCCTNGSH